MDIFFIALYLILQVLLGIYLTKYVTNESDFFLAGRKLPTFAIAFSIFATWFGAETCIGSSSAVFQEGLSGSKAEPIGYGLCLFFTGLILAPRLWNEKYTTLGDFFKSRYGQSTEKLATWILLPSSIIWAAAQVRAFGQVISLIGGIDINLAITISTTFVILYTLMGGLLGDIITDVIQGAILGIGLLLVFFLALNHLPLGTMSLGELIPSEKLTFISESETIWDRLDSWMIPILGSLVAQELISRVLAAKNSAQAVKSTYAGMGLYLFFGSIPIVLGLLGHHFNLTLDDPELFLPTIAKQLLPQWAYIIFAGALISAILSTIDSILLASSALVSHNFLLPTFKIEDPKSKLLCARLTLVVSGIISYIIALFGDSIYEMVELASSFGTTGILIITIGGLYLKNPGAISANVTLILGLVFSIIFEFFIKIPSHFTLSILILLILYLVISALTQKEESLVTINN